MDIVSLKRRALGLEPVVRIGKKGLTDETVQEIKKQLKKKKLIKIKVLRSGLEDIGIKELTDRLVEETGSVLVSRVGFVVVLFLG